MIIAVISVTLMSAIAKLIGPEYNPIQIAFIGNNSHNFIITYN